MRSTNEAQPFQFESLWLLQSATQGALTFESFITPERVSMLLLDHLTSGPFLIGKPGQASG